MDTRTNRPEKEEGRIGMNVLSVDGWLRIQIDTLMDQCYKELNEGNYVKSLELQEKANKYIVRLGIQGID